MTIVFRIKIIGCKLLDVGLIPVLLQRASSGYRAGKSPTLYDFVFLQRDSGWKKGAL